MVITITIIIIAERFSFDVVKSLHENGGDEDDDDDDCRSLHDCEVGVFKYILKR